MNRIRCAFRLDRLDFHRTARLGLRDNPDVRASVAVDGCIHCDCGAVDALRAVKRALGPVRPPCLAKKCRRRSQRASRFRRGRPASVGGKSQYGQDDCGDAGHCGQSAECGVRLLLYCRVSCLYPVGPRGQKNALERAGLVWTACVSRILSGLVWWESNRVSCIRSVVHDNKELVLFCIWEGTTRTISFCVLRKPRAHTNLSSFVY